MGTRVLLAEDNLINQRVAQLILKGAGYEVDTVGDGCAAVEACITHDYEAVIMDCQMPELDGLDATRQIRKLNKPQPSILAVTAHAVAGYKEECLESGMDDYLTKPYHPEQLLKALRERLQLAHTPEANSASLGA